jgi:anti-anti-sigma regulatory factor
MQLNSSVREHGEIVITSGSSLTIENAAEFSRVIREALHTSKNVVIEFEPTVEMDITCIQILCAACKSAAQVGVSFSYAGVQPQALIDLFTACGAERHAVCKYNNDASCIWFGGAS